MSALAWWLIPIGATVLALIFVVLRTRTPKEAPTRDSMDNLRRMQEAMERPLPGETNPPASSSNPS